MKRVLIITPFFVPVNAADMHRVRQSISYYKENGWQAEVVMVDPIFVELNKDDLLLKSIPPDTIIHKVKAFDANITRKIGLGSIAYRSLFFYYKYVNALLKTSKFDLVFFSTTAFPLTILGRLWKKKFKIPYVIDMQDPWRSDHYFSLPKSERPPKFWLSYQLDSFFEKFAMKRVDGIMSVSPNYIEVLKDRYRELKNIPTKVIPFAAYPLDIEIAKKNVIENRYFNQDDTHFKIVYIGRGGADMVKANTIFFKAIKLLIDTYPEFQKTMVYFIGTSYDTSNAAIKTIEPIAINLGIGNNVLEFTKRIPYFESLGILNQADLLYVPGSDNIGYTASKIYPYVWFGKPLITLFHSSSSVNQFMSECKAGLALQFDMVDEKVLMNNIIEYIKNAKTTMPQKIDWLAFEKYTSAYQVKKQVELFNEVLN